MGPELTRYILHRQNTPLTKLDGFDGVEIDIRSRRGALVVGHDSDSAEVLLADYLEQTTVSFLALNAKEEGLIEPIRQILEPYDKTFFIFGCSVPELVGQAANDNAADLAWRVSDLESIIELEWVSRFGWIWLDFFGVSKLPTEQLQEVASLSTRIVLASPELHSYEYASLLDIKTVLGDAGLSVDTICTKQIGYWMD